jgi:hypothetical protein
MPRAAAWLLVLAAPRPAAAQVPAAPPPRPVSATGRFTAWGELYGRDGAGNAARPDQTGRITANLTLDFGGLFQVPLTAIVSTDQVSFRQEINQFGLSPRYRWVQLHGGYFTPVYSRYSLQDNTVLGGGVDLSPGPFRVGAAVGRTRRAVLPDTAVPFLEPAFERRVVAGHVGVRDARRGGLEVFALESKDDPASLAAYRDSTTLAPGRSRVLAVTGELPLAGRLLFQVEGATSRHLRNVESDSGEATGYAGSARLTYNRPAWSVGTTADWVDAAFVSFGNQQLGSDRLDLGLTARARLAGGRVSFAGMGGWRRQNLSQQETTTGTRAIFNLNADFQPVPAFGLGLQVSNNQNRNRDRDADTTLVRNVTAVYSATPRFVVRTGSTTHVLVLMGMLQKSDNESASFALVNTQATTFLGSWTTTFPFGVSLLGTATRTEVEVDTLVTSVLTVAPGLSLSAGRGRFQITAQAQFTRTETGDAEPDTEVFPLAEIRLRIDRVQSVRLRSSLRRFRFGTPQGGEESFTERVIRLEYTAAFRR